MRRMMMIRRGTLGLLCLALGASSSWGAEPPADIAGSWVADVATPYGVFPYAFELKVEGTSITGTAKWAHGDAALEEGKIEDGEITFVEQVQITWRKVPVRYRGRKVGDHLHLVRRAGEGGDEMVLAHRAGSPVPTPVPPPGPYPFQNPDLPMENRITDLLGRMTLDEKIACLGTRPNVPRLGVRGTGHVEGLHGLAMGGPGGWGRPSPVATTQFPQAIGMAQTWDPELIRQAAFVEGIETRYMVQSPKYRRGGLVVRAPNADLGRDPRWGRTEECFGEDPFLVGTLSAAMARGLQGDHPRYLLTASLMKHLLANSNEDGRVRSSSDFDERLLREYYSVPFRMGVQQGGSRAYMAAYNAINGVPATVHPFLRDVTMREWGVDGIICTDAGALANLVTEHKRFATPEEAAAASIKAGINQFLDRYRPGVEGALAKGLLAETDIDGALRGVFRTMIRLGLLDPPERVGYNRIGVQDADPWESDAHKALARKVTQRSIVLLKNATGLLPLDREALKSIAVIGPWSDVVLLDWYSGTPPYTVTPLAGIRAKVGEAVTVRHALDDSDGAAVAAAKSSDLAVVVVGNHPTCNAEWEKCPEPGEGKEAMDRKELDLAASQVALVEKVLAANPKTVVVLKSSFPYSINSIAAAAPAIVQLAHNSQEEGNALADVLFGDVNPGGRLVQTWPALPRQLPAMMDYDLRKGRTYMYLKGAPLYPFGHGLSYTKFLYTNLRTGAPTMPPDGSLRVSVDVKNSGSRAGDEVVQFYVEPLASAVPRPQKILVAFERATIGPGQTRTITATIRADQIAYWDVSKKAFTVETGKIRVHVGASSSDIRLLQEVEVKPAGK